MRYVQLFLFALVPLLIRASQNSPVTVQFHDLESRLSQSPVRVLLNERAKSDIARKRAALQWRNPELEAEHEALSSSYEKEQENMIIGSKSFSTPWVRTAHKKFRSFQVAAAESQLVHDERMLLAEWKTTYVKLQLLNKLQQRLRTFSQGIQKASDAAGDRYKQGTISGLENKLIQTTVFHVKGSLLHLSKEYRELESKFKTELGVASDKSLVLKTPIDFVAVDIDSQYLMSQISYSPLLQKYAKSKKAAASHATMEKGKVVGEFKIKAGYKQVNDDFRGSVIGLSLPLPVLNQNQRSIEAARSDVRTASIEYDLARQDIENRIREHIITVRRAKKLLSEYAEFFRSANQIGDLFYSFENGWLSLGDLLSGIRVSADGLQKYTTHLSHYYRAVFQLEALTGHSLIEF